MATTKKTPTKKKATVKGKGKLRPAPLTWKFYVVTIGIFLVAVTAVVVIGLFTSNYMAKQNNQARLDRINDIYASFNIDERYQVTGLNVFGDKRVYEWDKGRTYSSSIDYVRGATVSETATDLDAKIKAAGFKFIDEPYPGSVQVQYHYKSDKGEYVRLSVSSKPYNDAWRNASAMGKEPSAEIYSMDKNAGPASVTLKVNLDDNNE